MQKDGGSLLMLERNHAYLGDCLQLMRQLRSGSIDMILCDLPYGITENKWDCVLPMEELWRHYHRIAKLSAAIVLTACQPFTSVLIMSNLRWFKYCWIWDKRQRTNFLNSKKQPLRRTEDIVVFYRHQCVYNPQMAYGFEPYKVVRTSSSKNYRGYSRPPTSNYGSRRPNTGESDGRRFPDNILTIPTPRISGGHPTQKPIALFEYLIATYSNPGDLILDNCAGSGTTAIAAKNLKRDYILIEKDPDYYGMLTKRITDHGQG